MLYKICRRLARSDIFFYLLIWLMCLLVIGTIAEQQQGLYYAQQNYFSVYFFWIFGFIPLPGTYTILTAIFINLLCKLSIDKWHIKKLGSLVTHISGLLLLFGGFLTSQFSNEAYIELSENNNISNQLINYTNDYNNLELLIQPQSGVKNSIVFNNTKLYNNNILDNNDLNFKLHITDYCKHCKIINKNNNTYLKPLAKLKDGEPQHTIISLKVIKNNNTNKYNFEANNIIYIERNISKANITVNNTQYNIILRPERKTLPFSIALDKFDKTLYPGTDTAKSYKSDVTIYNNNKQWHKTISMNNPLRYKGYTLYQSSYYQNNNNNYTSVIAIVYNVGQNFPYIASIILCIGILLHLMQRIPKIMKR